MKNIILIIRDFLRQMRKKNISAFSSSAAFFLFLSLGPLLAEVFNGSLRWLPFTVITMAWAAGKGTLSMMRGLNVIHDVEEERNYFVIRVIAFVYTLAIVGAVVISLGLIVFSNYLVEMLLLYLPQSEITLHLIAPFRYLLVWFLISLILASIYSFLPSIKYRFKHQLPGAMFASGVWNLFSWGFSIYVQYVELSVVSGSLTVLSLSLLWLYIGMYIILLGAYMNRYFGYFIKGKSL